MACNDYNYPPWWNCCESINLSNYVTHSELEDALKDISGDCECDLTEITAQISALQAAVVSLNDKVQILEDALAECCSGYTPTPPTPDTGETVTPPTVVAEVTVFVVKPSDNFFLEISAME